MSAAVKAALASGEWQAATDKGTGRTYYVNKKTRKTTWDLEKELSKQPSTSTTTAASPSPAKPSGVSAAAPTTAATGASSSKTKKTLAEVLAEGEWVEKKDPATGRSYYVNKTTRKTTWDLAKDLGLSADGAASSASSSSAAAQGPATSGSASSPAQRKTLEDVLKEGEWVEKKDPGTGKSYFFNKTTRKTTWDLAKDLGLATPGTPTATAGSIGPASSSVAQQQQQAPEKKNYDPKAALASGEWREVKDWEGNVFYRNDETHETTADLALHLQIKEVIDGDATATTTLQAVDFSQGTLDDWTNLFLNAPNREECAARLLREDTRNLVNKSHTRANEAWEKEEQYKVEIEQYKRTVESLRESLANQQQEIHQLQCTVFYGLGEQAMGGYVPPAMDVVNAHDKSDPANLTRRINVLERLLYDVQNHNRKLMQELQDVQRDRHQAATCPHCTNADPWKRMMSIADSGSQRRPL